MDIISTFDIDAPVNTAWQILGEEFGEVSDWAEPVVASSLDRRLDKGAIRTCNIKAVGPFPAGEISEELSEFNRRKKVLTYVIKTGGPPFLSHLQNRWVLERRGASSSLATSTITYRLKWWAMPFAPFFSAMMKKSTRPIFDQFRNAVQARYQAESGANHASLSEVA